MFENLLILTLLGCFAYFANVIWYVYKSQIIMTLSQFTEWFESRKEDLLKEVGGEGICSGKTD